MHFCINLCSNPFSHKTSDRKKYHAKAFPHVLIAFSCLKKDHSQCFCSSFFFFLQANCPFWSHLDFFCWAQNSKAQGGKASLGNICFKTEAALKQMSVSPPFHLEEIWSHFIKIFYLLIWKCCYAYSKIWQTISRLCYKVTTSQRWRLATEKQQSSANPYLHKSSCVESLTFFLFLPLPWWWGLLLWWALVPEDEPCWPWWPLLLWRRDVLAFPPLLFVDGVEELWLVRWLATETDLSLWGPKPRLGCCLAVLHGVPSESASLELELDVEEGDSGEDEGEERRDGDGEDELEDILLWGAASSSSSLGTLLLHSSSCCDNATSFLLRGSSIWNWFPQLLLIHSRYSSTSRVTRIIRPSILSVSLFG